MHECWFWRRQERSWNETPSSALCARPLLGERPATDGNRKAVSVIYMPTFTHISFFCPLGGSASAAEEGARGVREVREGPAEGVPRRAPPPPQLKRVAHHGGVDPSHQVSAGLYALLHAGDTPTKETYDMSTSSATDPVWSVLLRSRTLLKLWNHAICTWLSLLLFMLPNIFNVSLVEYSNTSSVS